MPIKSFTLLALTLIGFLTPTFAQDVRVNTRVTVIVAPAPVPVQQHLYHPDNEFLERAMSTYQSQQQASQLRRQQAASQKASEEVLSLEEANKFCAPGEALKYSSLYRITEKPSKIYSSLPITPTIFTWGLPVGTIFRFQTLPGEGGVFLANLVDSPLYVGDDTTTKPRWYGAMQIVGLHYEKAGDDDKQNPDVAGEYKFQATTLSSLTLRTESNVQSKKLTGIPLGAPVSVDIRRGGLLPEWSHVTYQGFAGFVQTKYLQRL